MVETPDMPELRKLSTDVLLIKRRPAKKEDKPKMYLKVRELLANVKTDLSSEVIEDREKYKVASQMGFHAVINPEDDKIKAEDITGKK